MGACCGTKHKERKSIRIEKKNSLIQSFIEMTEPLQESYNIIKKIGEGATSHVKMISCKFTNTRRAVKTISVTNPKQRIKAEREIEMLKIIDHPTVIRSIESFKDSSSYHIVSELYTGQSLYDILKEGGGIQESKAIYYMNMIASGIRYIHNLGIIHRDIKPENIIFESESQDSLLKIIDFGSAKYITKKLSKKKCGTILYMSPQVLDGEYSEKCDVWSAGILFYIMIAGSHPFYSDNEQDLLDKVRHLPLQFRSVNWKNVSPDVMQLISSMLSKSEDHRPTIAQVLQNKCFQNLKSLPESVISSLYQCISEFKIKSEIQRSIFNTFLIKIVSSKDFGKIFLVLDQNGNGKLNFDKVQDSQKGNEIRKVVSDLGGNYLNFTEFMMASLKIFHEIDNESLKLIFSIFDRDADGLIYPRDLKDFSNDEHLLSKEFQELSANKEDFISLQEFYKVPL